MLQSEDISKNTNPWGIEFNNTLKPALFTCRQLIENKIMVNVECISAMFRSCLMGPCSRELAWHPQHPVFISFIREKTDRVVSGWLSHILLHWSHCMSLKPLPSTRPSTTECKIITMLPSTHSVPTCSHTCFSSWHTTVHWVEVSAYNFF